MLVQGSTLYVLGQDTGNLYEYDVGTGTLLKTPVSLPGVLAPHPFPSLHPTNNPTAGTPFMW